VQNPISWDYLTASIRETATWGPLSVIYVGLMVVTLLGSVFIYLDATKRFENHKLKRDTARTGTQIMMWISAIALFFFAIRYMRFEFLSFERRIWMYFMFLIYWGTAGYFVYYLRTVYPPKLAAFDKARAKRRYSGGTARPAARRTSAPRRKRVAR
jgi:hypothetical protein